MARIPESIGKYKVESLIAKGGMGAVFKAIHPTLNRTVIIKKLNLQGRKDITERFKREARILMDFRHDGIVNMYDHFKLGTSYYIVLEFIDGKALDKVIKKERYLDNPIVAYILYQTAVALNYAHNKKVIHRDIKPANLLLSKKGEIKLVDFGIAVSDEDSEKGLTKEGMSLGTPGYMSPEQLRDSKNVDHRTDIYSLGVLAYEMLTGKRPFPGFLTSELITSIQKGKYPNPRKYNPHISSILLKIIRKSMHPKPEHRYQDLIDIIKKLKRFLKRWNMEDLSNAVSNLASGKDQAKLKPKKKKKVILKVSLAAISLIILLMFGIIAYYTGIHNELFHHTQYGYVTFSVWLPKVNNVDSKKYIHATIFYDDRKINKVKNSKIIFRRVTKTNDNNYYHFLSFPIYLKEGVYSTKVETEDNLSWYNFIISPAGNHHSLSGKNVIIIDKYQTKHLQVNLHINSSNIFTGDPIKGLTSIEVYQKGRWSKISEANPLFSGETYNFRIKNKFYYTKYFSIKIKENQKNLNINIGLIPMPGMLVLERENKHIHFLLNGQKSIISAERIPKELFLNKSLKFIGKLPPWKYSLEIRYKNKKESIPFKLEMHKKISFLASIEPKSDQIKYNIQ